MRLGVILERQNKYYPISLLREQLINILNGSIIYFNQMLEVLLKKIKIKDYIHLCIGKAKTQDGRQIVEKFDSIRSVDYVNQKP